MAILQHDLFDDKQCEECKERKPLSAFRRADYAPDGLSYYCRICAVRDAAKIGKRRTTRDAPKGKKQCPKCREIKKVAEFGGSAQNKDGLASYCRTCAAAYGKQYNPQRRAASWQRRYGISEDVYWGMFQQQGGVCAICKQPETRQQNGILSLLAVDHCHATGRVRGLLCQGCNHGLGNFKDDATLIAAAIVYLRR